MTRSVFREPHARLQLLVQQEARVSALRAELMAGEESGEPEVFDFDAFLATKKS